MSTILPKAYKSKTGQMFTVRSARFEDAKQMLQLVHTVLEEETFMLTMHEEFQITEKQEASWILSQELEKGRLALVAEAHGQLIGMLNFQNGARRRLMHQGDFGMSVRREWRGQGVGKALLSSLIAWAESSSLIEKICLEVFSTNEIAINLYTSLGFKLEGHQVKQVKEPDGQYIDILLMGKLLDKQR